METINIAGKRFGRLVVEKKAFVRRGDSYWDCVCDCGKTKTIKMQHLVSGSTKSCGCYQKERVHEAILKHGESKTRLYKVWAAVKQRCENPNYNGYKNYGGRGIFLCKEWQNYETFRTWALEHGYVEQQGKSRLTIDRIDPNGNYEPNNCRIATYIVQARNKRNNHNVEINGKIKTISEWSLIYNISGSTIRSRISQYGWDDVRAITTPAKKYMKGINEKVENHQKTVEND